jgi:hypothetical protein
VQDQLVAHIVPGCIALLNTLLMCSVLHYSMWRADVVLEAANIVIISALTCTLASWLGGAGMRWQHPLADRCKVFVAVCHLGQAAATRNQLPALLLERTCSAGGAFR